MEHVAGLLWAIAMFLMAYTIVGIACTIASCLYRGIFHTMSWADLPYELERSFREAAYITAGILIGASL